MEYNYIDTNRMMYYLTVVTAKDTTYCQTPQVIRGSWFSWENGRNTLTEINDNSMTGRGECIHMRNLFNTNYTFVFRDYKSANASSITCYHCVQLIVRTVNVLEKLEGK